MDTEPIRDREVAADLVIEFVSPVEVHSAVIARVRNDFASGARLVAVVESGGRSFCVYHSAD